MTFISIHSIQSILIYIYENHYSQVTGNQWLYHVNLIYIYWKFRESIRYSDKSFIFSNILKNIKTHIKNLCIIHPTNTCIFIGVFISLHIYFLHIYSFKRKKKSLFLLFLGKETEMWYKKERMNHIFVLHLNIWEFFFMKLCDMKTHIIYVFVLLVEFFIKILFYFYSSKTWTIFSLPRFMFEKNKFYFLKWKVFKLEKK